MTFEQLLESCSNPDSASWELGWKEFIRRYKRFMYNNVTKTCVAWNVSRLQKQLSDSVNDIVSESIFLLCRDGCKALRDFRTRDSEQAFLSWLAIICRRTSSRYIQQNFTNVITEGDLGNVKEYIGGLDFNVQWELYEHFVEQCRISSKKKKNNIERDIHIFQLYAWADFSADMISSLPCLNTIGHRVVDNVVNRMRKHLKFSNDL